MNYISYRKVLNLSIKSILFRIVLILIIINTILLPIATVQVYAHADKFQTLAEIKLENEHYILLDKINDERAMYNLPPLKFRDDLNLIARQKAEDLVENNYFAHTSEKYGKIFDMLKANEIDYKIAGENLAGASKSDIAVDGWMNSPSHRDNILEEKYEYTGLCIIESKTFGKVFVQIFLG